MSRAGGERRGASGLLGIAGVAGVLLLAGCGGGGAVSPVAEQPRTTPTTTAPAPAAKPDGGTHPETSAEGAGNAGKGTARGGDKAQAKERTDGADRSSSGAKQGSKTGGGSAGTPNSGGDPAQKTPAGGDGEKVRAAQATIVRYVSAFNAHDPALCTDIFTQRQVEHATGRSGQAAVDKCKRDIAGQKARIAIDRFERADVQADGSVAISVIFNIANRGRRGTFSVIRDGDRWKIDFAGA
jgi:hypothetical protein